MKDPAFLFYSSDFLTGTMLMTDEQVGKYMRLLCLQHQKGHLSEKDMLKICSSYDEEIFSKFKKDENGLYYNDRLEKETAKRAAYSESRRKNRSGKPNKDMNNICESHDEHMENENINEDLEGIKGGLGEKEGEELPDEPIKEPPITEDSAPYKLAQLLYDRILRNDPKARKPDLQKWAGHVDKLLRIDKRTPKEIQEVIVFAQSDNFWMANILSTASLRKQFTKLLIQCKAKKDSGANKGVYHHIYTEEDYSNMITSMDDDDDTG